MEARTTGTKALSQEQVDAYHTYGYIAVADVLTADEVSVLQRVTDEFVERSRAVTEHTDVFDLEPDHTPNKPKLRRLKSPHKQHEVYDRILRHDGILDRVAQLVGSRIRHQNTKLNLKSPQSISPVEWHQDWAFYPHTNDDVLAVGVAIDDMTLENGPLMVVPETHRDIVYDHHHDGYFVGAMEPGELVDRAVPLELAAGSISIHHARLVHGSAPNTSARPRRFLLFEYSAADAWPLDGISTWEEFNSRLLRGEPTTEPRLEPVPVRVTWPKHPREGSIFEVQSAVRESSFATS